MSSYQKTNPSSIQHMFGSIATRYDRTNAILSFQLHKIWNAKLVDMLLPFSQEGPLLDLCCGTGDIAFSYLKKAKCPCKAYLLDFCSEMLECASMKAATYRLDSHEFIMIHADAQAIPLPEESIACISMAYGIRNVSDPSQCAKECYRVLAPGGIVGILELTRPSNSFLRAGHSFYLHALLPLLGKLITANRKAYQYLCDSIQNFISAADLKNILLSSGFKKVDVFPLHGGIATIWLAYK